ncbi:hypothetical protein ATH33_0731 [Thermoactinomyces vulgaris]|nr:hypothetical protein ATH33_0731 [Thermoactinomyces vulgaris]
MLESANQPLHDDSAEFVASGLEQEPIHASQFFPGPFFGAPFIYPRPFFYFGFFPFFRPFGRFGPY